MKKFALSLILVAAMTISANADITYAPFAYNCNDAGGVPIANGTWALVVDLDHNGNWGSTAYTAQAVLPANNSTPFPGVTPGPFQWDSNDLLLGTGPIGGPSNYDVDGWAFPSVTLLTSQMPGTFTKSEDPAVGDHVYMMWFDLPYGSALHSGVHYGIEDLGPAGIENSAYTPSVVGGNAGLVTVQPAAVPEPATLALLAVGGVGAIGSRIRRRKSA